MDTTQAETTVRFLAWRFGVKPPRLQFTRGKGKYGCYHQMTRTIKIGRCPVESSLLHEFAHHLDAQMNGKPNAWYRRGKRGQWKQMGWFLELNESHSESFYHNLRRVVEAFGMVDYPWAKEYRQIARWAKRDGLTS